LRNAVYNHLIAADNLLDAASGKQASFVEAAADDYNFDARQEVRLASDKLICLAAPAAGGQIYELDVRSICHNLLATIARRPEAYHRRILAGAGADAGALAAIGDKVVFKQPGLDQRVQYDRHLRRSLVDHFHDEHVAVDAVRRGEAPERGDFVGGVFDARIRRSADRAQVLMTRAGNAWGHPLKITKGITLEAGGSSLEIAYLLEGLPERLPDNRVLHFGIEFNLAGLPSGADDRYFHRGERIRLGRLETVLDLKDAQDISLTDEWLGIDVRLGINRPSAIWAFPVETVSQSEGGFELVHQSVVVQPHWLIKPDADGRWSVTITLSVDTRQAESRIPVASMPQAVVCPA
jgi:alpha-amylase